MAKDRSNKIYTGISNGSIPKTNVFSKERINHDTLISSNVADQFNTYRTWGSFNLTVDVDPLTKDDFKTDSKGNYIRKSSKDYTKPIQSTGVRSLFNKLHAVPLETESLGWRTTQNMPLLDSPKSRQIQRAMNSCTVRDLVQKSQEGLLGTCIYDWSDFMYCKYLGRISNNYMITLRRYTIPVSDYVKPYGTPTAINGGDKVTTKTDNGGIPLGCMVTWLGTPGNEMSEIMKYSFNMPFKEATSEFNDDGFTPGSPRDPASKGFLSAGFGIAFSNGAAQRVGNIIMPGIFNPRGGEQRPPGPAPYYDDTNKAYSGVDMIKSIYVRDPKEGLKFNSSFKLVFDYELRSYDGVNGKQALLDLLGNILTVCYTTGDFWPGTYRSNAHSSSYEPHSSLECMKHHNTFSGYIGAFERDFMKIREASSNFFLNKSGGNKSGSGQSGNGKSSGGKSGGGTWDWSHPIDSIGNAVTGAINWVKSTLNLNNISNIMDNLGGFLLGGNMAALNPSTQQGVNGLLSDSAVGFWHITVGNPCSPILSMGNMILKNTTVEHYGPLGLDDFPTGLRVTCEFEHGKPRDKRLIERMYIGGNDRIYMPLDENVAEILKKAKEVNQKQAEGTKSITTKNNWSNLGPTDAGVESAKQRALRNEESARAAQAVMSSAKNTNYVEDRRVDVIGNLSNQEVLARLFGSMPGTQFDKALKWSAGEVNQGVTNGNTSSQSTATEGTVAR